MQPLGAHAAVPRPARWLGPSGESALPDCRERSLPFEYPATHYYVRPPLRLPCLACSSSSHLPRQNQTRNCKLFQNVLRRRGCSCLLTREASCVSKTIRLATLAKSKAENAASYLYPHLEPTSIFFKSTLATLVLYRLLRRGKSSWCRLTATAAHRPVR